MAFIGSFLYYTLEAAVDFLELATRLVPTIISFII